MSRFAHWLRITDTHAPAQQVLADAAEWLATRGITVLPGAPTDVDYAQIDPELEAEPSDMEGLDEPPPLGLGYAGFGEEQRYVFIKWAEQPERDALPAFHQLYCASLEVNLIQLSASGSGSRHHLREHIGKLLRADSWLRDPWLTNLWLLDKVLNPEEAEVADVYGMEVLAPSIAGVTLGQQALRSEALTPLQVRWLGSIWRIDAAALEPALVALRLDEVRQRGIDLLGDALAALPENARQPKPWRSAHRDLRFALSQPDLRPTLEPRLRDALSSLTDSAHSLDGTEEDETNLEMIADAAPELVLPELTYESGPPERIEMHKRGKGKRASASPSSKTKTGAPADWQFIVEFSEGRSQYTTFALEIAQKLPGYTTLLDEDRTIVHRVLLRKSELRRFWRLWDYIQGWSSTHVYLNGKELEKWQVWPWSHYLR